ncbi:3452_t:CDS:2, partial [Acaulospora colombiana]
SDVFDNATLILPHLSHATTVSAPLLTFLVVTLLLLLPALPLLPLRPIAFVAGIFPFILTHPTTQRILPPLLQAARKVYLINVQRIIDNDRLDDAVWSAPMKEVELWENERWSMSAGTGEPGWSKANLKRGERKGWSRRRDGWSDADALGGSLEGDLRLALRDVGRLESRFGGDMGRRYRRRL